MIQLCKIRNNSSRNNNKISINSRDTINRRNVLNSSISASAEKSAATTQKISKIDCNNIVRNSRSATNGNSLDQYSALQQNQLQQHCY